MHIVIVQYNAGNIFSVDYALKRLGIEAEITGDHTVIKNADKVIFPGVGEASTTMRYLQESGLDTVIKGLSQPVLGICIGMQLMCNYSQEGDVDCLGIFDDEIVSKFIPLDKEKIPHMGWNSIFQKCDSPLFYGISNDAYLYFVHSFRANVGAHTIATTNYAGEFSAALQKDNFYAVQFHPEKSGEVGAKVLNNFIRM